jgi:hypothetical protein
MLDIDFFFFNFRKALQDKAMQKQTLTNQRDAPGRNTSRAQGYLSSYLRGGAPGERHRANVGQTVEGATQIAEDWTNAQRRT